MTLPPGWCVTKFGDLWEFAQNGCSSRSGTGTSTVVLRLADVSVHGVIAHEGLRTIPLPQADREKYQLKQGDLLVFRVNGSPQIAGRVVAYHGPSGFTYCDHFIRVRLRSRAMNPKIAAFAFQVPPVRAQVASRMVSTAGQNTVSQPTIAEVELPLPPLPEQHRIVAAIESYFSRLDEAVALLERLQRNLKRYRASVLKAAVEGRLVSTEADLARAEGRTYEPASVLLERILEERRHQWEAEGGRGTYKEPVAADTTDLPELPEGWCWASLDQLVGRMCNGTTATQAKEPPGVMVSRIESIAGGLFDPERVGFIRNAGMELIVKYRLLDGDILFSHINSASHAGKTAVFRATRGVVLHGMNLMLLRVVPEGVLPDYLHSMCAARRNEGLFLKIAQHAVNQVSINQATLKQVVVPLPPRVEQKRIVAEIAAAESNLAALGGGVSACLHRCSRLRQSILKWAFEGKLADQDPTDEPASVLLERIRAERAEAGESGEKARRGRRPKRSGS